MRASLALFAAAAAVPATAQTTVGAVPIQLDGTLLEISAEGRTTRVPDLATIRAGVISQAATASAALSTATLLRQLVMSENRAQEVSPVVPPAPVPLTSMSPNAPRKPLRWRRPRTRRVPRARNVRLGRSIPPKPRSAPHLSANGPHSCSAWMYATCEPGHRSQASQ